MADDSSSTVKQDTGGDDQAKHRPDNQPNEKGGNNLPPLDGDGISQPGFFRYTRDILIAGILATGIWIVREHFRDQGYIIIAHSVNFVACIAFFTVAPIEALKHWRRPFLIWPLFLLLMAAPTAFVFFRLKSKPESPTPRLSLSRIQLASDQGPIRTSVGLFNPDDLAAYDVLMRVAIDRNSVPADSLVIETDEAPALQTALKDNAVNVFRINARSATNTHSDIVYLKWGFLAATSTREMKSCGTKRTNGWADLSVVEYKKTLCISDWQSNVTKFEIASDSAIWKDAKRGIMFPLTNLTFGGVSFTNGRPAFTNVPHLKLALDTPDFGGANQFNLINDFVGVTNNVPQLSDITSLLMVPCGSSSTNPVLTL